MPMHSYDGKSFLFVFDMCAYVVRASQKSIMMAPSAPNC